MLNIPYNLLNTVLKVKKRVVVWALSGLSVLVIYPHDYVADWELLLPLPSIMGEDRDCVPLAQGRDQKLKYSLY